MSRSTVMVVEDRKTALMSRVGKVPVGLQLEAVTKPEVNTKAPAVYTYERPGHAGD